MRDYEINSDLKQSRFENLKFVQYDNGSTITVNVFEDGQAVSLTNCTVLAKYKRADGKEFNRESTVTDNKIVTTLDSTVTAVEGELKIIFKIKYNSAFKQIFTFVLNAKVKENFGEGNSGDIGGNTDTATEKILNEIIKKKFSNAKNVVTSKNLLNTTQFENVKVSDLLNQYNSGDLVIDVVSDAFIVGQAYNTEVMFTDNTSYAGGDFFFQFLRDSTVLFSRYTFNLTDLPNKAKLIFNKTNMLASYADKTIKYVQVCKKASGENYPVYETYCEDVFFDEIITKSELNNFIFSAFLYPKKIRFIGHRGGTNYPENTILSFKNGCKSGYDFIETDIWQTSDGELVCIHDQTVDRTTNGTGDVMAMTLEEIKALTIDTDSNYTGLKVPTLKEFLLICKKYGKVPIIEIKNINQDWEKLSQELSAVGMHDNAIILCSSIDHLTTIKKILPKIHCSYLIYSESSITTTALELLQALGNTSINTNITLTENTVKLCHSYDVLVGAWTIDDATNVDAYAEIGIDFITTNNSSVLYL